MAHTSDGHTEHTGHGGHHVFDAATLKKTFYILVGLTLLTVVLALWERGFANVFGLELTYPALPVGGLSVPIALAIAGTKVYWVASRFMGLKYEKGSNVLIFLISIVFLVVFFSFTYLDFAFRDTFAEVAQTTRDDVAAEAAEAAAREELIQERFLTPAYVEENGEDLLGPIPPSAPLSPGPDATLAAPDVPAPAAGTDGN